ncbi:histidine kinase, partial [Salinicoccus roseus]
VIAAPIMIVIITYAATFFAQVDEKIKTQMTLEKLELAHRQVKQLTLQNERQRMARDLHDTLAQGLVSLHMQLEAVHVH